MGFPLGSKLVAPPTPPPPVLVVNLECLNLILGHFPQHSNAKAHCVVCNRCAMRHESWTECSMCKVSLCGGYTGWLWFKTIILWGLLFIIAFCHFLIPYSSSYCICHFQDPRNIYIIYVILHLKITNILYACGV